VHALQRVDGGRKEGLEGWNVLSPLPRDSADVSTNVPGDGGDWLLEVWFRLIQFFL